MNAGRAVRRILLLCMLAVVSVFVIASPAMAASVTPTHVPGASGTTCAAQMPGTIELKQDGTNGPGPYNPSNSTLSVTIVKPSDGSSTTQSFDWTSHSPNVEILGVLVKSGETGTNWYDYSQAPRSSDTYLTSPQDGAQGISHISFCYKLAPAVEVSKSATATYDKEYTWEIDKSVLPVSQSAFVGDQVNYTWKVTLTKSANYTKTNYRVTGKIWVYNPANSSRTGTLTDVLDDSTVATITGCTGDGVTFTAPSTLTVNGKKTAECTYTANPSDNYAYKNTAKFTVGDTTYTGYKSFSWGYNWVNEEVVVDDDQYDQFPKTKDQSYTWTYEDKDGHLCSSDISKYEGDGKYEYTDENTAVVKTPGGDLLDSATATATVTCYAPVVSKTANASSIVTNTWTIDKQADGNYSKFIGDAATTHNYTVSVDKSVQQSNVVAGTISVYNPRPDAAMTVSLADSVGGTPATLSCDGSLNVPGGQTKTCHYSVVLPSATNGTNTATATFKSINFPATANYTFGSPTNVGPASITVKDNNVTLGTASDDKSWPYTKDFSCPTNPAEYTNGVKVMDDFVNTAKIVETNATDSATVKLTCYAPEVSKTANASHLITNTWTIDKQADGTYSKFIGDAPTTHNYTVSVDKGVEESFAVAGTINVANPAGSPGEITVSLADLVGGTPATLSCGGSLNVPVGESRSCDYTAALGSATNGTNTATATFNSINFAASADYVFGTPTVVGPATINVTDNDVALGSTSVATSWPYTKDFVCPTDPAAYTDGVKVMDDFVNTAKIVETNQTDTATVKLTCYAPVVSKSASTEWTRTYTWGITKDVVPAAHSGYPGDNFSSDYIVSVDQTVTDSGYRALGTINVSNPAGSPGVINVDVTDAVNGSAAVVDCDAIAAGNQGSIGVNVGESIACSYSVDLPDNTNLTNTAQVSFNQINFAATAPVTFGDPTIVGFPTINVSDFFNGDVAGEALGTASGDATFPYFRSFVCPTEESAYTGGLYNQVFPNTAKIVESGQSADANVTVSCELRAGLGDLVWHDLNADGVQNDGNPSQPGVSGVTVNLLNGACDVPLGPTGVTDANGLYSIVNLDARDYCVQFVIPAGYVVSSQNAGADDSVDSDGDTTTGKSALVTLVAGQFNPTLDLGLYKLAKLGDRVWVDDGNGVQDANEPNVPGVTVTLFSCADTLGTTPLATDVTDDNGLYLFDNLMPGCYYVTFSLPPAYVGYTFTTPNSGAGNALDSDADSTGKSEQVTLASDDENLTLDAGIVAPTTPLVPPASLGDRVWVDNANGVQDASEANVPGVTVTLFACTDTLAATPLATDVTDGDGLYLFDNLAAGCYYVVFTLPSGYSFTTANVGNNALDSDADSTGRSEEVTLAPGDGYRDLDAGIITLPVAVSLASLGDRVWEDNDNGVQDDNEPNVPGVTVTLYACTDTLAATPLATDVTDENGLYLFDQLMPDCYYVIFTLPEAYEKFTTPNVGDNTLDSDANATGRSEEVTLGPGIDYRDLDSGVVPPVETIVEPPTDPTGLPEGEQPLAQTRIFLPTLRHEK